MTDASLLEIEDVGAVRVLRINRPEKLGALSSNLLAELGTALEDVETRRSVRALIITGTGRGFIAGADIAEYYGAEPGEFAAYQRRGRAVFDRLAGLPKPTVASVNGFAFGGGFEIALCCDFIIASEAARFALPEVKLGLSPGGGGTQRLARQLGTRYAADLVLTGRVVKAREAFERGLARMVTVPSDLESTALKFATELAALPPLAVAAAKRVIDAALDGELADGLAREQQALISLYKTHDAAEGVEAFIKKRPPVFVGS